MNNLLISFMIIFTIALAIVIVLLFSAHSEKMSLLFSTYRASTYKMPQEIMLLYTKQLDRVEKSLNINVTKEHKIPKKIYRIWCVNGPGFCSGRKAGHNSLKITTENAPEWEQIIYTDKEIDNFVRNNFPEEPRISRAYFSINEKYRAARADLARLLIVYKYGGLYMDMKSCLTGPIPDIPNDKDMYCSHWIEEDKAFSHVFGYDGEIQNWYIYGRKGSSILKDIITHIVTNIENIVENSGYLDSYIVPDPTPSKLKVIITTGPFALTTAIKKSSNKGDVYISNDINKVIGYNCDNSHEEKGHYSTLSEDLILQKNHTTYIPKNIYMTYYDLSKIPAKVFDALEKYTKGYNVEIYDDRMCKEYLEKNYGKDAVEIFDNFTDGAHKADFWRFCILYQRGGIYMDIKTILIKPLDTIFIDKKNLWYTVLCYCNTCIYNGIIASPPFNPVLRDILKYMYKNPIPYRYHEYIIKFLNFSENRTLGKFNVGLNKQRDNWECMLFEEICYQGNDRYGLNCSVYNKSNKVFGIRYDDFPW